jgi:hypothetical protein
VKIQVRKIEASLPCIVTQAQTTYLLGNQSRPIISLFSLLSFFLLFLILNFSSWRQKRQKPPKKNLIKKKKN